MRTLLYIAQMGKFFSHYGLRSLLVLYLVKGLALSDFGALSLSALFCSLVELSSLLGGAIADRYLGVKRATMMGAVVLALGYGSLALPGLFFAGLSLVVAGASLFASNIYALFGLSYRTDDSQQHAGFTRMYALQNLGALAATLLCASVASVYGFQVGFIAAATGMAVSSILLCIARSKLDTVVETPPKTPSLVKPILLLGGLFVIALLGCTHADMLLPVLPWVSGGALVGCALYLVNKALLSTRKIYEFFLYLAVTVVFYAIEDQICSSLMLLAERSADRSLLGWEVPSAFIMGMNPIVILLLSKVVATRKTALAMPFVLTAGTFGLFAALCALLPVVPLMSLVAVVTVISASELMLGPLVSSYASQTAPSGARGLMMGMIAVAFSLSFQLSGLLGRLFFSHEGVANAQGFAPGFAWISGGLLVCGLVLHVLMRSGSRVAMSMTKR